MIEIRAERPNDSEAIAAVHQQAFGGQQEARLVELIRAAEGFAPALSLVGERDGRIVGHVLFSPIEIETETCDVPALALAPVGVLPECQRQGTGTALVRGGLDACRRLAHEIVVVLGHATYYPRFGFVPASTYGVYAPFPVADESFMILPLRPDALEGVAGVVRYPPAFDAV